MGTYCAVSDHCMRTAFAELVRKNLSLRYGRIFDSSLSKCMKIFPMDSNLVTRSICVIPFIFNFLSTHKWDENFIFA